MSMLEVGHKRVLSAVLLERRGAFTLHSAERCLLLWLNINGKARPMRKLLVLGIVIGPLWAGAALGQTTAPPTQTTPAPGKTTATKTPPTKVRSAESIECSKQADAKSLHGKERKKFRAACKKQLTKKG
jgi:hypothetical protein